MIREINKLIKVNYKNKKVVEYYKKLLEKEYKKLDKKNVK